ncbi:MAG TPA: DUF2934 domain-containing protein [Bryobacteraceae bacterium]|jgi:hypothetical protein
MKKHSDQDGKSKTASAVDAEHYPEQHEVRRQEAPSGVENDREISQRAYAIWRQKGCPEGSAEEDWFEAAEQLRAKANSNNVRAQPRSGSVQH